MPGTGSIDSTSLSLQNEFSTVTRGKRGRKAAAEGGAQEDGRAGKNRGTPRDFDSCFPNNHRNSLAGTWKSCPVPRDRFSLDAKLPLPSIVAWQRLMRAERCVLKCLLPTLN